MSNPVQTGVGEFVVDPRRVRQAIKRLADLPFSFPVVKKAIAATEDPESSDERICQLLAADQALATSVLRVANSAYFALQSQVRTLTMAIAVLGRDRLRALLRHVLVAEAFQQLAAHGPAAVRLRDISVAAGAAAAQIAEACYSRDLEEPSIAGLVHNIGESALCSEFREEYETALRLAPSLGTTQAQIRVFGVHPHTVGKWLLEAWSFPVNLVQAVECWEAPLQPSLDSAVREFLCVVHAGARLAEAWSAQLAAPAAPGVILPEVLSALRLHPQTVASIYEHLPQRIDRLRESLQHY